MRCRSWRLSPNHHSPLCEPGTCFRCWRPCRNVLGDPGSPNPGGVEWEDATDGQERCRECAYLLAHHPLAWVRMALISEPRPVPQVISVLSEDGDFTVALTAQWHQHHQPDPFDTDPFDSVWR